MKQNSHLNIDCISVAHMKMRVELPKEGKLNLTRKRSSALKAMSFIISKRDETKETHRS